MNEQLSGIVRHVLTAAGGALVAKGYADEATVQALVGGLIALIGVIWSVVSKKKSA